MIEENNRGVIWKSLRGHPDGFYKFREAEEKLLKTIVKKGFNCIDAGFNYGWFSYNFLKRVGREGTVYAWEPNKFLYENYLKKWPFKNLKGYNHALGDKKETQRFYIKGVDGMNSAYNSLIEDWQKDKKNIEFYDVEIIKLDDWWVENLQIKIDIIKIDCEGYDYKILLGAENLIKNSKPKYIIIEQNKKIISEFMETRNYKKNHCLNTLGLNDIVWELEE